jgi:hypothetical protein
MTPKEKAKDLVDKYLDIDSKYEYLSYSMAKQCALIAVDQIQEMLILTRKRLDISDTKQLKINDNNIVYSILWFDEVKQEIEQL